MMSTARVRMTGRKPARVSSASPVTTGIHVPSGSLRADLDRLLAAANDLLLRVDRIVQRQRS
jgi:hypothetical protein